MRAKVLKGGGLILFFAAAVLILAVIVNYFLHRNVAVLQPAGTIGRQERSLMFFALLLCAMVVIPVFFLTIFIATKYRESNRRPKKYRPDWDGDRRIELTWWAIPLAIITTLAVVTWFSSYHLDPYKALASSNSPMEIDVVALNWKWLFIYPDQNIATVNYVRFPLNTPVDFHITSDSVMNSFWIPNLGGQIYAMPGMSTHLNLMADRADSYQGGSANISGTGFARMNFTASASSLSDFNSWVKSAKRSTEKLDENAYLQLAKDSSNNPVKYYSWVVSDLYSWVVDKYALPPSEMPAPGTQAMRNLKETGLPGRVMLHE